MMVSRLNNCIKRIQQLGWTIWKQLLTGTVSLMLLTRWRYCLSVTESKKLGLRGNELVHKRTANVTNNQNNTLNLCITCETCHPRSYLNLESIVNMETMAFLTDLLLLYMFYTHCLEQQHTHICTALCPGTTRVSRYQKGKTNLDFTEASGIQTLTICATNNSGISWAICKSASRSRQLHEHCTTQFFIGWALFLPPNRVKALKA